MAKKTKKDKAIETVETIQDINTLNDLKVYLVQQASNTITAVKVSNVTANKIREIEKRLNKFDEKHGYNFTDAYRKHLNDIGIKTHEQVDEYIRERINIDGVGVVYLAGMFQYLRREYAKDDYFILTDYEMLENVQSYHLRNVLDRLLIDVTAELDE